MYDLCTFITECTTGVQTQPAPESNQSDSGPVRLLKPAIIQTHPTQIKSSAFSFGGHVRIQTSTIQSIVYELVDFPP